MTDTITPASLRAHADHMERVHLDGISAEEMRQEAARLEAEAAREVEVLQLAKRLVQEEFGGYNQWHDLSPGEQERRIQYVKFILAFLAADGRLLPEGGIALTRREVENFVTVLQRHYPEGEAVLLASLRHRLGTPPAVSVPDSGPEDPCGGTGTVECWNPGGLCTEKVCELCGPCRTCDPNAPILFANSGPDGTPEKPWPTWQDVPEGVRYCSRKQRHHRWVNRNGERFTVAFSNDNEHPAVADEKTMKLRAPFVRVDGDKA